MLVAAVATLGLVALALDDLVAWWHVCVPGLVAAVVLWTFFSCIAALWVLRCRGTLLEAHADDEAQFLESSLDTVLSVFKFCIALHGYLSLVVLALAVGLVAALLDAPPAYWLTPIVLIGVVHLAVGALLKEPEVTPLLHATAGLCILGHVATFAVKLGGASWPWAVIFIPSWLSYLMIPVLADWPAGRPAQIRFALAIAAAICFSAAQVTLVLRIDGIVEVPWSVVLVAALVAVLLVVAAVGPAASRRTYTVLTAVVNTGDTPARWVKSNSVFEVESDSEMVPTPRIAA